MAKKPTPPKPGKALSKGQAPRTPEGDEKAAGGVDPVQLWSQRIISGGKDYDGWAKDYEVERCRKYYNGKQWHGVPEETAKKKYAINMVFATVETQLPSLMFTRPKVTVEPRPARAEQPGSDSGGRATLIESTLQTYVDDRDLHFTFETTLSLRDAYSHFGLVEVGYSADWIDNPNADKPVLKENSDEPLVDDRGETIKQPKKTLKKESLFLKRIPPQHFRVGPGRNTLLSNDWVAYYEWHYLEDVKKNPDYDTAALSGLQATGIVTGTEDHESNDTEKQQHAGQVKLWKIWDLRKKVRLVMAEGHPKMLQQDKPFTYLPLAPIKFYEIADSWFPLPPIYNWLSPQDEINETREGQRTHRRRFVRRYMREPSVSQAEFDKLEAGEDGVCIEVPSLQHPPIAPIPDADLSAQNGVGELAISRDDFNRVAGVSGESQGVPQSDTATQANIINVREQIRESRARTLVAEWLGDIVRLMMLTIKEKMQGSMVVKMNTDPFAPMPQEAGADRKAWKEIQAEDLGDLDMDVKVDLASLSPVAEDGQRQQWNVVLQLLTNPALAVLLMTPNPEAPSEPSPLLRKTLSLNGVKSDQEVREIWRIGQAALKAAADAEQAKMQAETKPDLPRISYGFKDLSDPLVRMEFMRATGLAASAEAQAQAQPSANVPSGAGGEGGGIAPLAKTPQPITGTPAAAPGTGG